MSEQQGWIKLHRKLFDWEWYTDANVFRVFMHLLLTANHSPKKWRGMTINTGELIISIGSLAKALKLSEQQTRTALNKLEKTGEIKRKSTNKNTLITVVNYEVYQGSSYDEQQTDNNQITNEQQTDNNQITNEQQTDNNQITTNKNDKNDKNDKELVEVVDSDGGLSSYGLYSNVLLTEEQFDELSCRLTLDEFDEYVARLDEFIEKGAKVHNHYKTILKWVTQDRGV